MAGDVWLRTITIFGGVSNLGLMGYQSIIVVFLVREVGLGPGAVGLLIAIASSGGVVGAFAGRRVAAKVGTARAMLLFELVLPTLALLIPLTTRSTIALYVIGAFGIGVGVVAEQHDQGDLPPVLLPTRTPRPPRRQYLVPQLRHDPHRRLARRHPRRTPRPPYCALDHHRGNPLAGLILLFSPIRRQRDLPDHQGSAVPAVAAASRRARID